MQVHLLAPSHFNLMNRCFWLDDTDNITDKEHTNAQNGRTRNNLENLNKILKTDRTHFIYQFFKHEQCPLNNF